MANKSAVCPICGDNLKINKSGFATCGKCDYSCITINPQIQDYSIYCMVCGLKINSGQLCDKCKDSMLKINDKLKEFK